MDKKQTIAITGSTGGIGREICKQLAKNGENLVFVDRNLQKSKKLASEILNEYPNTKIDFVSCDMADLDTVNNAVNELSKLKIDTLVLNAGIYNVPLSMLQCGYNNVFQVNFLSQYILTKKLLSQADSSIKKVVAVGSIAYKNIKFKSDDVDYSKNKKPFEVYGNSKKFLMMSMFFLAKDFQNVNFCVAHPGISSTNMITHYPKYINWFVKAGTKILFPSPQKASKNIVEAIYNNCGNFEWIGPKFFDVYGKPTKKPIKFISEENKQIKKAIDDICSSYLV